MTAYNFDEFRHKLKLHVRYMDIDAFGHVNNARYLNFLEEARISYSQEALGLFKSVDDFNVLVARVEIDFKRPIVFGDNVSILTRVSKIGTKSFTFESLITVEKKGEYAVAASALQTLVTVDKSSGKSTPIEASIISAIEEYQKNQA